MLFYTTLLITSLLISVVILAVFNLCVRTYRKFSVSRTRTGPTAHLSERKYGKNVKIASKPWEHLGSHVQASTPARPHPAMPERATPWGWPGGSQEQREPQARKVPTSGSLNDYLSNNTLRKGQSVQDWKRNVGRPARDVRSSLAGETYKPSFINFPDLGKDDN